MKDRKLGRLVGFGAVALVVLGAIVVAGGGVGGSTTDTAGPLMYGESAAGESAGSDGVMSAIDQALGRPSSGGVFAPSAPEMSVPPLAPSYSTGAKDMDLAQRAASGSADTFNTSKPGASNAAGGGTTGGGGAPTLGAADDRKIVQTATMRLQVKEVGGSFEEVGRIATSASGFIASSNFSLQGEQQIASLTVRVPTERYQDVLRQIRELGVRVDNEGSNASDVTEEYTDPSARLRNLEATETQLLQFLTRAANISEVLQVQDRLNTTRGEIERVKGRMALLDKLTDLSTITVHLRPVVGAAGSGTGGGETLGSVVEDAWQSSLNFLGDVGAAVLTVVIFVWWVPLLGIPVVLIASRVLRNRPHTAID